MSDSSDNLPRPGLIRRTPVNAPARPRPGRNAFAREVQNAVLAENGDLRDAVDTARRGEGAPNLALANSEPATDPLDRVQVEQDRRRVGPRMNALQQYRQEHELVVVHREVLRGASVEDIAATLRCSTGHVEHLLGLLMERRRNYTRTFDASSFAADTVAYFDRLSEIALEAIANSRAGGMSQAEMINAARGVRKDMVLVLKEMGAFRQGPLARTGADLPAEERSQAELDEIKTALRTIMAAATGDDAEAVEGRIIEVTVDDEGGGDVGQPE